MHNQRLAKVGKVFYGSGLERLAKSWSVYDRNIGKIQDRRLPADVHVPG